VSLGLPTLGGGGVRCRYAVQWGYALMGCIVLLEAQSMNTLRIRPDGVWYRDFVEDGQPEDWERALRDPFVNAGVNFLERKHINVVTALKGEGFVPIHIKDLENLR